MAASRLRRAIAAGMAGGDLAEELYELGDYRIATVADALCVCEALKQFPLRGVPAGEYRVSSPLHAIVGLFQNVETEQAVEVLARRGVPELCRIFDASLVAPLDDAEVDALLFLLKILALYPSCDGTMKIVAAVRRPFHGDRPLWSVILGQFTAEHPYAQLVCEELRDPLPEGQLAGAYLDMANQLALSGSSSAHPFDTPAGKEQLRTWLCSGDRDDVPCAHSAAASLPFVSPPEREDLLALALDHRDPTVQIEAAWASARLGSEGGLKVLARFCHDPRFHRLACQYLQELGRAGEVPAETQDRDFQAMAEMCHWLAHPNEFGRPPESIEQIDARELNWPPTNDRRRVWLFRYRYPTEEQGRDDEMGIGMVGSVTFALLGETTADLAPEDVYALHCCWELEWLGDARAPKERSIRAGRRILRRYNP